MKQVVHFKVEFEGSIEVEASSPEEAEASIRRTPSWLWQCRRPASIKIVVEPEAPAEKA